MLTITIIIIITFTSSVLEGVHRRQSLCKVFTCSQGNLEQLIWWEKLCSEKTYSKAGLEPLATQKTATFGGKAYRVHLRDQLFIITLTSSLLLSFLI